jgi:muconolactone delta-isomerase
MLFFFKATLNQPLNMTERQFYEVWRREAEAALRARKAGVIKALWKVSGLRQVIGILDVASHHDLDRTIRELPITKEIGHSVSWDFLPVHEYDLWAEDLKKLAPR